MKCILSSFLFFLQSFVKLLVNIVSVEAKHVTGSEKMTGAYFYLKKKKVSLSLIYICHNSQYYIFTDP